MRMAFGRKAGAGSARHPFDVKGVLMNSKVNMNLGWRFYLGDERRFYGV